MGKPRHAVYEKFCRKYAALNEKLGKIAAGYLADFTLFEANPLDGSLQQFAKQQACMTVVGGSIVYDAQSEADMDLYRIMTTQQL